MTQNLFDELRKRLADGWYPSNLDPIITLTEEASWQVSEPLALFVVGRILRIVALMWDPEDEQHGPSAEEFARMHRELVPAVMAYLDAAAERPLDAETDYGQLNELVRAFLAWRARRI